jgi:redox-sensitive bicupin YhaK (pirin superfamily)
MFFINGGWFTGYWHFSFDRYYDPGNNQFGSLRVFNVDTLVPGAVWPMHPHRDIEVVTYCVDGVFEHADNLGNKNLLYPGDVQHTTVGKGMWHSEINHLKDKPMTFIQVWILPSLVGLTPSVEVKKVKPEECLNRFLPVVSSNKTDALPIHQDAEVYLSRVSPGVRVEHELSQGYGAYLYLVSGKIKLNGQTLSDGDAAKVVREPLLTAEGVDTSEVFMVVVRV